MPVTFRPGEVADGPAVYDVFVETTADLDRRMGLPDADNHWLDADFVASYWRRRQTLFDHLARTADQFWVAESDGRLVGFARSSVRDGVRELLEFFVRPGYQGQGVGGEEHERAGLAQRPVREGEEGQATQALRLSLRAHPMELLRPHLPGLTAHATLPAAAVGMMPWWAVILLSFHALLLRVVSACATSSASP